MAKPVTAVKSVFRLDQLLLKKRWDLCDQISISFLNPGKVFLCRNQTRRRIGNVLT